MCPPAVQAALIMAGTTAIATKYQSDQNKAAEERQIKRQKEAEKRAAAERNAQEQNTLSEASPLLIKQGGKSSKGLSQLKVAGSSSKGYNSLGMGGSNSTGLNIANG